MATYRFIGVGATLVVDGKVTALDKFGQKVDLADEQARFDVARHVPLLTDAQFLSCGFTDEEVAKYGTPALQVTAPASFAAKKAAAVELLVQTILAQNAPKSAPFAPAAASPDSPVLPTESENAK